MVCMAAIMMRAEGSGACLKAVQRLLPDPMLLLVKNPLHVRRATATTEPARFQA